MTGCKLRTVWVEKKGFSALRRNLERLWSMVARGLSAKVLVGGESVSV
jgi:hypothetical protein